MEDAAATTAEDGEALLVRGGQPSKRGRRRDGEKKLASSSRAIQRNHNFSLNVAAAFFMYPLCITRVSEIPAEILFTSPLSINSGRTSGASCVAVLRLWRKTKRPKRDRWKRNQTRALADVQLAHAAMKSSTSYLMRGKSGNTHKTPNKVSPRQTNKHKDKRPEPKMPTRNCHLGTGCVRVRELGSFLLSHILVEPEGGRNPIVSFLLLARFQS